MDVRQVRPTDAPLVLALALDEDAQLVTGPATNVRPALVRTMALATVPLAVPGRSWIARADDTLGLLEVHPRQYVMGWDVARLAVQGDPTQVLSSLMQAATLYLQSRGVPRLFARCSAEHRHYLTSMDFMSLAREYVLMGPAGHAKGDAHLHIDSRYRMPQDAWPLHQLESDTTPALVRQLEGLTSSDWSHKSRDMSEVVVEQDGRIVAWIGWGTKRHQGTADLGMLVHPDYRALAPNLLAHALDHASGVTRFVTRVRDYRVEILRAFTDAGFQIIGEEAIMVKHAGMEVVQEERAKLRLGRIPSIQGVNTRLHNAPDGVTRLAVQKRLQKDVGT